jgi:hypothetical protein
MKIADVGVDNYHGEFIYNFGSPLDRVRPILYGGLGATYFRGIEFTDQFGQSRNTGGNGQFSTTWGGGVKIFPSERFGIQLDIKWTPTYIKSDPDGYWCDPTGAATHPAMRTTSTSGSSAAHCSPASRKGWAVRSIPRRALWCTLAAADEICPRELRSR